MLPADVEKLLANIRMADYRIDDLLTDVNPQRWKLSPVALGSFQKMNAALHTEMKALDGWRGRFEKRPDSIYLGFETYTAINQVLPRLTGVAHAISQNENANYGAQFSEAGDHLFDLQQTLGTYLESLLGSQDQMIMALDNNLAGCQNTLSYAMRSSASRPIPMRNEASVRPERRRERKTARNRREKAPSAKSSGSSPAAAKKNPPAAKDAKKL